MTIDSIVAVLENKNSNETSLIQALTIVRNHIDYCVYHNIDMLTDPLFFIFLVKIFILDNNINLYIIKEVKLNYGIY